MTRCATPTRANPAGSPRVSPDGKLILCRYFNEETQTWGHAVLTYESATVQRLFRLPASADGAHWYLGGKEISFVDTRNGVSNIWSMPVDGGEAKQITNFTSGLIFSYAWSYDWKHLAVARGNETSDVVLITQSE